MSNCNCVHDIYICGRCERKGFRAPGSTAQGQLERTLAIIDERIKHLGRPGRTITEANKCDELIRLRKELAEGE